MDKQPGRKFGWNYLKEQSLLQGLSDEQIHYLYEQSEEEKFLPNELIIEEGEKTTDVYLILEGEVNVLKWDEEHCSQVVIGHLNKGDAFGEMSFMDNSPRSTTIKASKPLILLRLAKDTLISVQDILAHVYANIAIVNINRLRISNKNYVRNLLENQHLYQIRQTSGQFLIYQYMIFSLIVVLISQFISPELQIYLPWLLTAIPTIAMIRANGFDISHFGVNIRKWFSVFFVSLVTIALTIGLLYAFNLIFHFYSIPYSIFEWSPDQSILPFQDWPAYAIYCLSQEFIARGVLQTALQEFLHDEKGYKSIVVNAFFLFLLLLPLGVEPAFNLFLIGLPLGLLYLKQKSIWGVFLIHFFLMCLGILKI